MGMSLIRQPDGKWGLFSSYSDRIVALDLTREELIEAWAEQAANRAREEMRRWIAVNEGEEQGYEPKPKTLNQALKEHRTHAATLPETDNTDYLETLKGEMEIDDELLARFPGKVRKKPKR